VYVPWVPPVLYVAVLTAGLYAGAAGLGETRPVPLIAGLLLLAGIDLAERRRWAGRPPRGPAAVLLAVRVALYLLVVAADGSGVSKALFVLVPLIAYFAFGRWASIGTATACLGAVVVASAAATPRWYADLERVSDLLMLGLGLVLAITMAAVAVEERRLRLELEANNDRLRAYAAEVAELSIAAERNRLARDIHDGLGHHLTETAILIEQAKAFRDHDAAAAGRALIEAHRAVRRALDEVRRSVRALHPAGFNLTSAVAGLGGGPVSVDVAGEENGHPLPVLTAVYRAAQEGITNARRHASAERIDVRLAFAPGAVTLVVADDGCGFVPDRPGFGLAGMRERIEEVGGQVDVDSRPGAGTRLTVSVPA
jgi:signal transduction histidine kinase